MYFCPMHPEIRRDAPGICPECGMKLLPEKAGGHDAHGKNPGAAKHEGHSLAMFARKFWLSLLLTVPVVLQTGVWQKAAGRPFPSFPGAAYLPFVLGSIVFFYGGRVFLQGAVREVRARPPA